MSKIKEADASDCFFCHKPLKNVPLLRSKRIQSIKDASEIRNDGLLSKLSDDTEFILCHKPCVSSYCSIEHLQRLKRKENDSVEIAAKRLRGSESDFKFREQCIFCGETCQIEPDRKNPSRWRKAYLCRTADEKGKISKEALLTRARERGDKWGIEVACRVSSAIGDLHAADARYHRDCYSKFYCNVPRSEKKTCTDDPFSELVHEMQADKVRVWNSVELYKRYTEIGGRELSRRSLVEKIHELLAPDLLILSAPGVASVLVFRSYASAKLKLVDDFEDTESSIATLATTIRSQCPRLDHSTYKTRISKEQVLQECSPTLLQLLAEISPSLDHSLSAAMVGHIVTAAVCKHATSLQMALSVLLSRQRMLVEELQAFSLTTSYDELRRFRCSAAAARAAVPRGLACFEAESGLVQVVSDNFDADVNSSNGQKSSHGLAMILCQAGTQGMEENRGHSPHQIRRLSQEEVKSCNLMFDEVEIQRYQGPRKPPMPAEFRLRTVPTLRFLASLQMSLQRVGKQDLQFLKQVLAEPPGPEFGGFNVQQARHEGKPLQPKTRVVYCPYLDMTPSEPDTVKTAMTEAQRLTRLTGQNFTVFTNDMQLYKETIHILWAESQLFPNFVARLGGMHTIMSFVGAIGSLMSGSGLEDVLSGTFVGVPKMLTGKKYPQNVRALRLVVEELLRPLVTTEMETLLELVHLFDRDIQESKTKRLWVECLIYPILTLMAFVRAEREGDWPLHLLAVQKMVPYFFSAGHVHYARYCLIYLRSMQGLHPNVSEHFMAGEHVMRHQDGLWNGLWSDMFIETTYMRYGHGPSGIIGSTLNETTLAIWAYSHCTLTQLQKDLHEMRTGTSDKAVVTHKEEGKARIREDAADRAKIRETLLACIDPLDPSKHPPTALINIFSGHVIDDPSVNVHEAAELGAKAMRHFENGWPDSFHQTIKKSVKTMSSVSKVKARLGKTEAVVDTEFIYARVLGIMASARDSISIGTLFSHELAAIPTSLFDENGDMRTTNKSVLKNKMTTPVSQASTLELPTVIVIDACALLWSVAWPSAPARVSDYIDAVVTALLRRCASTKLAHIIFDRYHPLSTKACCRARRQRGQCRIYTLSEESPLPKQTLVLNVSANKQQLISMIVRRLSSTRPPAGTDIVVTGPEPCPFHMGSGLEDPPVHHEEADVLIAHAVICEANAGHTNIEVVCDDTDVVLILAHHLYKQTRGLSDSVNLSVVSFKAQQGTISVNELVKQNAKIMDNILAAHCLTGCDTVSAFAGIGKATVLKKLEHFVGLLNLFDVNAAKEDIIASCLHFTSLLYGEKQSIDLNTLRAELFTKKLAGKRHLPPKLCSLPPTMNSFGEHCMRAHFQAILWGAAGEALPPDVNPLDMGWTEHSSMLVPKFGLDGQLPAPEGVIELVKCACKTKCKSGLCSCIRHQLPCTQFCHCKAQECMNPMTRRSREEEEEEATL